MSRPVTILAVLLLPTAVAAAGVVETACLKSARGKGQRQLCGCIQDAANVTLTARDQRRAAKFFSDPDEAQSVRASGSRRDEAFWERYERFGAAAEAYCGRG